MLTHDKTIDDAHPRQGCLIYVAPDCTDSAVQRRVHGFLSVGVDVVSFAFRRNRYNVDFVPDWPNVELGLTTERRLLSRLVVFLRTLWLIFGYRRTWRAASVLCARNLDLALLALAGKALTRSRASFVYEILDVHPATTRGGLYSVLLRWVERRVLARTDLLVVSSPGFLRNYFEPMQGYHGETFLLENKWPSSEMLGLPRRIPYQLSSDEPVWTIGWFGNIRCSKSLEILTELADAMPNRVRIYIRGCASLLGEQKLRDAIGSRDNMIFEGEYCAPQDLPEIYSKIHFNWCVDLCGGDNSRWLLPNRIYEGGYFGIPALAVAGYETGRVVNRRQLGITLESPIAKNLGEILANLTQEDYEDLRRGIERLPEDNFVDHGDLTQLMGAVALKATDYEVWRPALELEHEGVGQGR